MSGTICSPLRRQDSDPKPKGSFLIGGRQVKLQVLYTWKDAFAFGLSEIERIDLVTHSIVLAEGSRAFRLKQPRYSQDEVAPGHLLNDSIY